MDESLSGICACPICLDEFDDPVMLPCCQQSFCRDCLRKSLRKQQSCPLCRSGATIIMALPNRSLAGLLCKAGTCEQKGVKRTPYAHTPTGLGRLHWRVGVSSNPFLSAQHEPATCCGWLAKHEARLRCIAMIVSVVVLMIFLKLEEEDYAVHTGYRVHRPLPQIGFFGDHPKPGLESLNLPHMPLSSAQTRRIRSSKGTTVHSAAHAYLAHAATNELPPMFSNQMESGLLGYMFVGIVVCALSIYQRTASCMRRVKQVIAPHNGSFRDESRRHRTPRPIETFSTGEPV